MRIDRLPVLGALVLLFFSGCSSGTTTSIPAALPTPAPAPVVLRFIQGSPGSGSGPGGAVDVCIDTKPFGPNPGTTLVNYGTAQGPFLFDAPHVVSVYNAIGGPGSGNECATAPAAFLGSAPIATTTLPAGTSVRWTIILGGASGGAAFGLYVYDEPTYAVTPAGFAAIYHNAAPSFSAGKPGVGFGRCTTTVTPCSVATALVGGQNVSPATVSTPSAAVINHWTGSTLTAIPAGFYDGIGVLAGTPVPITSVASPAPLFLQAYVAQLYAIDAPAGGLNLLALAEQTTGFGF